MAGLIFEVNVPQKALSAATQTTIGWAAAPSSQRVKVKAYGFFFDGQVNSNQPIEIKLCRPTALGTLTASSTAQLTEQGLPETPNTTYGVAASAEPTLANIYKTITVHPQLGYEYIAPLGEEEQIKGGQTWVVSANAPQAVNIRGYFRLEE